MSQLPYSKNSKLSHDFIFHLNWHFVDKWLEGQSPLWNIFPTGQTFSRGQINSVIKASQPLSRNIYTPKPQRFSESHLRSLVTPNHSSFCPEHKGVQTRSALSTGVHSEPETVFCFRMNSHSLQYCTHCSYQNTR